MSDRMGWFWMFFEPIAFVLVFVGIRSLLGGAELIAGTEFIPWLIVGLFAFFLVRENMMRPIGAISSNKGLFAYRQVKPIDPVIARCFVEGMLRSFIFVVFILGCTLLDINMAPVNPLEALYVWGSLWGLGIGLGLVFSATAALIPEISKVLNIISLPLLIVSGVIIPLNNLPQDLLVYVLWNPIVHGIEILRANFFPLYKPVPGASLLYLWYWVLVSIALGLMMHVRFELKLKRQ